MPSKHIRNNTAVTALAQNQICNLTLFLSQY